MNENMIRTGLSREAVESAGKVMEAVRAGKIKKHLLSNTSSVRYGTMERKEMTEYESFIKTKLCCEIMQLEGEGRQEDMNWVRE